ncbi:DNA-directed RNA polymerase I subunit RPA1 [Patellaria atrata CBS 101060]|uniref:DNA-directed RNA polymerase subunit n=1 Tax=Patellaria atrata CBS 101060 TaxID=1346257 RepID=A0A9P4S3T1_9PEZI|nr:DNA-directed RNA polymerase I subunit RPA1 [Patellaria atrata CBS 101060]
MNISQPVASALSAVEFSFLPSEEIRALSVKRITNPSTFDSLLHPVPGGLYDSALGSFADHPCSTCKLGKFSCPGHCGHIELPQVVYHPTFMDQCLRLLRAKCVYCHRLQLSRIEVNRYVCKLRLIRHGLISEAQTIEDMQLKGMHTAEKGGDNVSESEEDARSLIESRNQFVKRTIREAGNSGLHTDWSGEKIETVAQERRQVIKEFLADITKPRKCATCRGISPGYRKDRYAKIFRKPLGEKARNAMIQGGFKAENPMLIYLRDHAPKKKEQQNGISVDEGVADMGSPLISSEDEDVEMQDVEGEGDIIAMEASNITSTNLKKEEAKQEFMSAGEVHAALSFLFERDQEVFALVYGSRPSFRSKKLSLVSADMFFIRTMLVPPNKYRPEAKTGEDEIAEAQANSLYKNVLMCCETMNQIHKEIHRDSAPATQYARKRGFDDLQNAWIHLQDAVNSLIDRDRNPVQGAAGKKNEDGIKQLLEKKEGLFRKHMMGKRVNFAARSVISPDPNIETNEIGVPPVFAKKLTYAEPVTNHNFYELKEAVINGPERWPGAVAIENENGQVIILAKKNAEERQALANQLLAPSDNHVSGARNKKVHRHLNNGDVVIMNRQPTLHKPSMMAHRAKVLPGEKTIRMHYANCKTYNADFDGDEMNMHFPQNEVARAEAVTIADTDHQYLSATAGEPLRGLIQDHISMGVWLTTRDTFYEREDYQQLLYAALRPEDGHTTSGHLIMDKPSIYKPRPLWTGKQVVSTVLKNIIPAGQMGLNLTSKSSTAADRWTVNGNEEGIVIFSDGEMMTGILDKKQIGPADNSIIHAVYETYGHTIAGRLLSVLGRLLTKLLHMRAFSCGVEDLILTGEGEFKRRQTLQDADHLGLRVGIKYVSLTKENPVSDDPELLRRLEEVLRDDTKHSGLDAVTNSQTATLSSSVTKVCLPNGLIKAFPKNQMQTMTGSGAKGSPVNANLISCNLGQQVLEGRRVPVMVSGKSLPCFRPFETSIRAGGYITDRFLTGIRPQEYFFHTMAGREGLIDTAVKTSRSGYLQRCLIKGMEGLNVHYDTSVRDSDGSMIQFLYGEDGLDVTKQRYLSNFKFMAENFKSLVESLDLVQNFDKVRCDEAVEWNKSAVKKFKKTADLAAMDPVTALYTPSRFAGSTSEEFYLSFKKYCDENKDGMFKDKKKSSQGKLSRKAFEAALYVNYLKSLVEAGEAVGVVAGQSVGEPSTQMTLNTFHLAGHSAKNVTLGIPRLREIVMTASANISTPSMTLFLNEELTKEHADRFAKGLSRLSLAEIIDKVTVTEIVGRGTAYALAKIYKIRLDFFPAEEYCNEYGIVVTDVMRTLEKKFCPDLQRLIRKELKKKGEEKTLKTAAKTDALPDIGASAGTIEQEAVRPDVENEAGDESDGGDDDATDNKQRANRAENVSYENPDEEEEAIAAHNFRESTPETDDEVDEGYGRSPRATSDADTASGSESEPDQIPDRPRKKCSARESAVECQVRILEKNADFKSFKFDHRSAGWCEISLEYDVETAKLLMLSLVEACCRKAVIQAIPGLTSCIASTEKNSQNEEKLVVVTEGTNLLAMRDYQDIINPHMIFTNDIAAMLRLYGVEACRATIVREMQAVFRSHSIDVDNRHLNLIGDVMTKGGGYRAFNRMGIRSSVSPFMKMSFETTVGFLKDAVLEEDWDDLRNPSARIVAGKLSGVGTGSFDILMPVRSV